MADPFLSGRTRGARYTTSTDMTRKRAEGADRGCGAAHCPREAGAEEAQGPKPGDRRGDHDRGQAGERRCTCASAREGEGSAAERSESPAATGSAEGLTQRWGLRGPAEHAAAERLIAARLLEDDHGYLRPTGLAEATFRAVPDRRHLRWTA